MKLLKYNSGDDIHMYDLVKSKYDDETFGIVHHDYSGIWRNHSFNMVRIEWIGCDNSANWLYTSEIQLVRRHAEDLLSWI